MLAFKSRRDNSAVRLVRVGNPPPIFLLCSKDGSSFSDFIPNKTVIRLNRGEVLELTAKTENKAFGISKSDYYKFGMEGEIECDGGISSLLSKRGDIVFERLPKYAFYGLFSFCKGLVSPPELPFLRMSESCYGNMFFKCVDLKMIPALPSEELAEGCYSFMFKDCRSINAEISLPAAETRRRCYMEMFASCYALNSKISIRAKKIDQYSCAGMFSKCASLSGLNLRNVTEIGDFGCRRMFYGCKAMRNIEIGISDWNAGGCATEGWMKFTAAGGTFSCGKNLDAAYGDSNIPNAGWKIVRFS